MPHFDVRHNSINEAQIVNLSEYILLFSPNFQIKLYTLSILHYHKIQFHFKVDQIAKQCVQKQFSWELQIVFYNFSLSTWPIWRAPVICTYVWLIVHCFCQKRRKKTKNFKLVKNIAVYVYFKSFYFIYYETQTIRFLC